MPGCLYFALSLLMCNQVLGQKTVNEYAEIDRKALSVPHSSETTVTGLGEYFNANFHNDHEKIRAIFRWITENISYDVENMYAINFDETTDDRISKCLKTHKGICENYAALFTGICGQAGIKSVVIEGYTKQPGSRDFAPHAWCAAMIDTTWYLFDPTWGAGYIDKGKFVRKLNNEYFKARPSWLSRTHLPFDCIWQLLNYPVTPGEFMSGSIQPATLKQYFNFNDSIAVYEKSDTAEQWMAAVRRIEQNGVKNTQTFERLQYLKREIETRKQNKIIELYNAAVADYNEGIKRFNDFIQYRNKQFTPKKTDPDIKAMIDGAELKLTEARKGLKLISEPSKTTASMIVQLTGSIEDAASHVREQQDWLKTYFSKNKMGRKAMFYERKVTWFGIPVN